jgi:hypothetical protein
MYIIGPGNTFTFCLKLGVYKICATWESRLLCSPVSGKHFHGTKPCNVLQDSLESFYLSHNTGSNVSTTIN